MGARLGGVDRRDDLVRTIVAMAVVVALGLAGTAVGRSSVLGQQGGASGSSSSEGSAGSSESAGSSGSSSSATQGDDGTSGSSGSSSGSSGSSGTSTDDTAEPGTEAPGDGGTVPGGGADTTAPSAPTTTIAATASTIPADLPDDAPPTAEVRCPDDVAGSAAGGRVRCFTVDPADLDPGDEVRRVGIPGIPVPVPLPAALVVPVVGDTGDSGSTRNDNRVTVVYDIDNRLAVDGFTDRTGRAGQRVLATLALLLLIPAWVALLVTLRRLLLRRSAAAPTPPPPPAGRWVWEPAEPEPPADDGDGDG